MVERYAYEPYGDVRLGVYDKDYKPKLTGPNYGWDHLFGGMRRSAETGLYETGAGEYDPHLGRVLQRGPVGNISAALLNLFLDIPKVESGVLPPLGPLAGPRNEFIPYRTEADIYRDVALTAGVAALNVLAWSIPPLGAAVTTATLTIGVGLSLESRREYIRQVEGREMRTGEAFGSALADVSLITPFFQIGLGIDPITRRELSGAECAEFGSHASIGVLASVSIFGINRYSSVVDARWMNSSKSGLRGAATRNSGIKYHPGLRIYVRVGKTVAEIVTQMDRITERIGRRMGISDDWYLSFERIQPKNLTLAIGAVHPDRTTLRGGEIILDWGIFSPGGRLQTVPLHSRIQAILTHEVFITSVYKFLIWIFSVSLVELL